VHDAVAYNEIFAANEVAKARELITLGRLRVAELAAGRPSWTDGKGLVVRGYVSRIDGSAQPYGLVIPDGPPPPGGYRLDVWFHGRGEMLSEVNFLDERRKRVGEFSPRDAIVLHPYGRYCNANKFAGEVDAHEAIESVRSRYPIDPDRIAVRGFSMGGASCWQFAVHYPDRWFAANPGAGFSETARFLNVFQRENLQPAWYEKALWNLYDCDIVAENLAQCPTVAYSGELDNQKQAADVMAGALDKFGMSLTHVIGPKTKHQYHPDAKIEVERRLASLAESGRRRFPAEVRFATFTLKYDRSNWVRVDGMGEHWKKARVAARVAGASEVRAATENVEAVTFEFPSGFAPFAIDAPVKLVIDDQFIVGPRPGTDRSWAVSLHRKTSGDWSLGAPSSEGLRKTHDLQGPIDDAFMDSFIFVRPTGAGSSESFARWESVERDRAIEHWRRHFRGAARVKDDTAITDADVAASNLVLWGDPRTNRELARIADRLPIAWTTSEIKIGPRSFDATRHALLMIYPNPLNPKRYVVLNSGFTFREYDYLNNARQTPKLPDWAVVDVSVPPDARAPGKVVAADFFGERWELRQARTP
jgi:hypothetical protein